MNLTLRHQLITAQSLAGKQPGNNHSVLQHRVSASLTALGIILALHTSLLLASTARPDWPPADLSSVTEAGWSKSFEEAQALQPDFRVLSIQDFKDLTAHYVSLRDDGIIANRFHLSTGELVHCVLITSQRSYLAQGSATSSLPPLPSVTGVTPSSTLASAIAASFGLDGTVDEEGNTRRCAAYSVPHLIPALEDMYRFRTLRDFLAKTGAFEPPGPAHEWAHASRSVTNWGSTGTFNVWSPYVEPTDEFSLSQLWVSGGNGSTFQSAEAGWQKYPAMYNNSNTHLFIYYTTNNYTSSGNGLGCYNLTCTGFVQTDSSVLVGGSLSPVSVVGGQQHEAQIAFIRNATPPFAWWLQFNGVYVGYYPASLYNAAGLATTSARIDFGGEIVNAAQGGMHTTTQMGSGRFPSEGLNNAAYTRLLRYVDTGNTLQAATGLTRSAATASYYDLSLNPSAPSGWGQWFLFGGPGRASSPISLASATTSASSVTLGQTFTIDYSIVGTAQAVTVMLGASLGHTSTSSWPYSDPMHDISVSVPSSASSLRSRQFTVSANTPSGTYDLAVALWRDRNGSGTIDSTDELLGERYLPAQIVVMPDTRALSISGSGTGQGTVTGSGINCTINAGNTSGTCSANYPSGTAVTLSATPTGGSTFSGWAGNCGGTGSCGLTMTANKNVTALFTAPVTNYTLSVTGGGNGQGTVTGTGINCTITGGTPSGTCSASYSSGTSVSLTATPAGGSTFSGWGGSCAGSGSCSVTMTASKNVSASFSATVTNYTLSVAGGGNGQGTVTGSGINCTISGGSASGTCSASYASGTGVSLTATPSGNSVFGSWGGSCAGSGGCSVTMTANRNVSASFTALVTDYTLSVAGSGSGQGTVAGSGINCTSNGGGTSGTCASFYAFGTVISLTGTPAGGSTFGGWSGEGCSGMGSCQVTMTQSRNVTATFNSSGGTSDLIVDGGFESANSTGNFAPGWITYPASGHSLIAVGEPYAHTGSSHARLGTSDSTTDYLVQNVTIPANAVSPSLTLWVNVVTQESIGFGQFDYFFVSFFDFNGNLVRALAQLTNEDAQWSNNVDGNYFQIGPIDVTAQKGSTLQLLFQGTTDPSFSTVFRVDDISLQTGASDAPPSTSITAPANGTTLSGTVNVSATASDDVGVTSLEIDIDGLAKASNSNSTSLAYSWNTTQFLNGPHTIVSKAGDGGGHVTTSSTITVTVNNPPPPPPANLVATATSPSQVNVTWNSVAGATYQVLRSSNHGAFSVVGTPSANSFTNSALAPNTTYLYQVKAVNVSNVVSTPSNTDLATTLIFTNAVIARSTRSANIDVLELRTAVNAVRAAAGLGATFFSDPLMSGVLIRALHIEELRTSLDAARAALGLSALGYTDSSLTGGLVTIKAAHINELRAGVQ
jgi:Neprosin/Bacterial Ig domain/Divergent InlB B-repeat domain